MTTVQSLNHKCAIIADRETDVKNISYTFGDSENKRAGLQYSIKETSIKIETDTLAHTKYQ